jgi:pyrophosphatase PpaX
VRGWAAVLFDLDGTLADTVELILSSYRHTMRTHLGEALPDERWLSTMGTPLDHQIRDFARDDLEATRMRETYQAFQREVHDRMVQPYPGTADVIRALRRRGTGLAVVTSKRSEIARRTLECCGLGAAFDVVVCADHVVHAKPDPEPVVRALERLGLAGRAADVLFVGDSPFDLRSGHGAGTKTAAATWGPFPRSALEAERPDYYLAAPGDVLTTSPSDADG